MADTGTTERIHGFSTRGLKSKTQYQYVNQLAGLPTDTYSQNMLVKAYGESFSQVEKDLAKLMNRWQAAIDAGEPPGKSWQMQKDRYERLMSGYAEAIQTFNKKAGDVFRYSTVAGVDAALAYTPKAVRQAMGTAPTGLRPHDYGGEYWGNVNKQAMTALSSWTRNRSSALFGLLEGATGSGNELEALRSILEGGVGAGFNPKKIARMMANAAANMSLGRARTIARTETARAFNTATAEQYKNADVVKGWVWAANLDSSCCPVCVAMSGRQFAKGDMLDGHPNCRCRMVPITKSWSELGFPEPTGLHEPNWQRVKDGPGWLANQTPAVAQRILGKKRYKDFRDRWMNGEDPRRIMESYVIQTNNSKWGPMKQLRSMKELESTRAALQASKSATGKRPHDWDDDTYVRPGTDVDMQPMTGEARKIYNDAFDALGRVLRIPEKYMGRVKAMEDTVRNMGNAAGSWTGWGREIRLRNDQRGRDAVGTVIHEYAHRIDYALHPRLGGRGGTDVGLTMLGRDGRLSSGKGLYERLAEIEANGMTPREYYDTLRTTFPHRADQYDQEQRMVENIRPWRDAVESTYSVKKMRKALETGKDEYGNPIPSYLLEYYEYLCRPTELWARSNAQYVAHRSGDVDLHDTVRNRSSESQWRHPDEYNPIYNALDDIYRDLGWLVE